MKRGVVYALLVAIVGVGAIGCGKKGNPRPPEDFAPIAVSSFRVEGDVDAVVLYWEAPQFDQQGGKLEELGGFIVRRSVFAKDEAPDFDEIAEVEAVPSDPKSKLPQQYSYEDTTVEAGSTYDYLVYGLNARGVEGLPSGVIRVTFIGESSVVEAF